MTLKRSVHEKTYALGLLWRAVYSYRMHTAKATSKQPELDKRWAAVEAAAAGLAVPKTCSTCVNLQAQTYGGGLFCGAIGTDAGGPGLDPAQISASSDGYTCLTILRPETFGCTSHEERA